MLDRSDRTIAAWLGLFLFGIYLLSFSGRIYSQDGMSMFSVTESFVKRGEFNTDQVWTLFKARSEIASDGESYAKYGYGTSLFAVPFYALALALPDVGLTQTALLTSAVAIAISGALVFLAARRLKYPRGVSLVTAGLFGLATPAWVYAKQLWSEPYALFTLFVAFYFLLCFREDGRGRTALIAGAALGLAIATRVTNAALVPFFAWYGFAGRGVQLNAPYDSRGRRGLALFALLLALAALSVAWYDWVRYGHPLATGYRADETFDNPIGLGAYGLLFSPGKGLFVYVPFLAVLPFSAVLFYRRARREAILIGVIFLFYVLLFSAWYYWWGGTNWSPRFLVPTIPFLALLSAPAIELALSSTQNVLPRCGSRDLRPFAFCLLFFALCLLAFAIELLGISIPSLAYRLRMVRLSANPEADAIFLPQFSPLVGYFNLLKPSALDFAWMRVVDNNVAIDWLVVALTLAFIAFCLVALRVVFPGAAHPDRGAKQSPSYFGIALFAFVPRHSSQPRNALLAMTGIAVALSLFSMYRYRDDARFGGSAGYRALLQTVQRDEAPSDVLILDNDVLTPFFLNENRARLRWYGLSRDPAQWDDATRALLARLSRQYARVWFAFDDSTAPLPDPTRDWLDQSLQETARYDFDDGVHLILFDQKHR